MTSFHSRLMLCMILALVAAGCGGSDKSDGAKRAVSGAKSSSQNGSDSGPDEGKVGSGSDSDSGDAPKRVATKPATPDERPTLTGTGVKGANAVGTAGSRVVLNVPQFESLFAALGNGATVAAGVIPELNSCAKTSGAQLGTCLNGKITATVSALTRQQQIVDKLATGGDPKSNCMGRLTGLNGDLMGIIGDFKADAPKAVQSGVSKDLESASQNVSLKWNETTQRYAQAISNECLTAPAAAQVLKNNPALKPFFAAPKS